ncbi:MAG: polyprenyl synthetase family protein, partial [Candidatus Bathyarchaeia archaeon]
ENVSEEEYFTMIGGKTASLFKAAAESGAIVGGGSPEQIRRLGIYAYNSGLSFQIADDVLGLTANEEALGKPVGSDIKEGKKTILIVHALKHATLEQRRNILAAMGNRAATSDQIERVIEIIRSLGSIEYATQKAVELITVAREQLNFFPDVPAKRALLELADFLVVRKY